VIGNELLDLVEVCDEELEDFLGLLFGPSRMEDDTDLTGIRRSNEPSVSYRRVINLYLKADDGRTCSVAECSAESFATFVRIAATSASKPEAAAKAIEDLDYTGDAHLITKWFAITSLIEAGASVPLFGPSHEPVTLSCGPRKPGRSHDDLLSSEASSKRTGYQGIDPTQEYHLALPLSL